MFSFDSTRGTVYWITGLAGSGKTTIGTLFAARLRSSNPAMVMVDGDTIREVVGNVVGHAPEERLRMAQLYSRLCWMLSAQGLDVVCATVSMFNQVRAWNREHLCHYREIWVRAPLDVLVKRDQKRLYSGALNGTVTQVMGMDVAVEEPQSPDVILDNDGSRAPDLMVDELMAKLGMAKGAA